MIFAAFSYHYRSLRRKFMGRRITFRAAAGTAAACVMAGLSACSDSSTAPSTGNISKINHIVVIYLENHSFDNLYGELAGAEGLSAATNAAKQVSSTGIAFSSLPQ